MSYITFKNIGISGDLGSQVLQYSALYAVAKENNKQIVFPESVINLGWGFKFCKLLNIECIIKPDSFFKDFVSIKPNSTLIVDPKMFNLDKDTNYNVDELFLLYHYWYPKYSEDISRLSWNKEYYEKALVLYESIKQPKKELVSLHVRRGDYLKHDHFCKLDEDPTYYVKCLEFFIFEDLAKYQFVIFSNDIEWCKENLISGEMVTFLPQGEDYTDLILMSMCDHNIIANSTYSWLAAYMNNNKNKKVFCPTNYLKSYSDLKIINGNYYPTSWINIDNQY